MANPRDAGESRSSWLHPGLELIRWVLISVVEYSTPEEAQKAIRDLNEQTLLGRQLFIREVSRMPWFKISSPGHS